MRLPTWLYAYALLALFQPLACNAQKLIGTADRPQLSNADAKNYTASTYLARAGKIGSMVTDNWNPSAGVALLSPSYHVAADGSAPFASVQAAVDKAVADGGTMRRYIGIEPGVYREVVCIPETAPPITLFGMGQTPSDTLITFNNANLTPKPVGTPTTPCASNADAAVIGTFGSATFTVSTDAFQARNLTFANDYVEGTYPGTNQSAVALAVRGDKAVFEKIAVLGNQDTLLVGPVDTTLVKRTYFKDSVVQGDTDFIFGAGIAVFYHSIIRYDARRLNGSGKAYLFAPSTHPGNPYGFLVIDSIFDVVGDAVGNTIYLGRAWDQSTPNLPNYFNGKSPNGQLTIRNSILGAHIRKDAPWSNSTAKRPYCSESCTYSANRFYEYSNSGPGSADCHHPHGYRSNRSGGRSSQQADTYAAHLSF
ncbi:putative acyl-CoA thioester hydrolase [Xanthomonas albilineans]|uniref:putative acyl-CoA thioester hydrolase n=1 Tax=Xanthomonas albilineans TaxID=29447 RepID=UPI0009BAE401|nr:putative acyl-CoA thioester hydrolase [Xanthomonas albilineans]PPU94511.1 acyl-CoA thioesterase [Xanthomonas albilineans]